MPLPIPRVFGPLSLEEARRIRDSQNRVVIHVPVSMAALLAINGESDLLSYFEDCLLRAAPGGNRDYIASTGFHAHMVGFMPEVPGIPGVPGTGRPARALIRVSCIPHYMEEDEAELRGAFADRQYRNIAMQQFVEDQENLLSPWRQYDHGRRP